MSTTDPGTAQAVPALSPGRRRAVLGVVALALMMVVSAVSGLNVALPDLAIDTGASQTQITWIVDSYTLVFAGLLLSAGALGDRFGRKGVLLLGLALFGAAAGLAMTTTDPQVLIALRAVMGMGAAGVMPVTLSIITTSFPPAERGRAVGVWVGVAGGGAVLGLFVSGFLLEFYAWNSFFGLNVVLALLAFIGTVLVIPPSRDAHPPRLDPVGAVLSLVGVGALVYGIIEVSARGWSDALILGAFALAVVSLGAFAAWELRREHPLLDPRLFRLRGFSAGSLALTIQFFGAFGMFFTMLQYLQYVTGRSPLQAAVALLPMPFVMIPTARNAPRIADRFGIRRVVPVGLLLSATGLFFMSRLGVDLTYWHFALALVVFAAGMGLAGTPATTAIVSSLPPSKQGVASAVNDTSRELGSALGIAILGSVLASGYRESLQASGALTGLPAQVVEQATSSVAFVQAGADQLTAMGPAGTALIAAAEQAFVDATGQAMVAGAAALALGAVLVAVRAPGRARAAHEAHEAQKHAGAGAGAGAGEG